MKIAYFDCFAGISGDMCLGALVNAGVSLSLIADELKKLPIANYNLSSHKVIRGSIEATKVEVALTSTIGYQASEGSKFADILRIIKASAFHDKIKESGIRIFKQLFEAEAEVNGELFDNVHLHELGGIDCLVDVFGTLIGIDALGIEKTYVS